MFCLSFVRGAALAAAVPLLLAVPARAQVDIAGEWAGTLHEDQPTRSPGQMLGDYTGIPLNDVARYNADSWHPSLFALKEHQAQQYTSALTFYAPGGKRISKVVDDRSQRITSYVVTSGVGMPTRTIWMDGREHPPEFAAHTWAGFSTGEWDGRTLVVKTTHMKAGYIARNGVRHTDRAAMVEYFARHGNYLTVTAIVDDPGYLDEPFTQSWSMALNHDQRFPPTEEPSVFEETGDQRKGHVPHYLPGQNPYLAEFAEASGIPLDATRGGRETMYPEYAQQLRHVQTKLIKESPAERALAQGSASSSGPVPAP
jgi:hypothetical protein